MFCTLFIKKNKVSLLYVYFTIKKLLHIGIKQKSIIMKRGEMRLPIEQFLILIRRDFVEISNLTYQKRD